MTHPLRCQCGLLQGQVDTSYTVCHCVCYCKDCQAFAHFLGEPQRTLDHLGGTEIVQISPQAVLITQGYDQLACVRLSPRGMLRWYSACCRTPIGNTLPSCKIAFVGLVSTCLDSEKPSLAESFGPVRIWANSKSAQGKAPANSWHMLPALARFVSIVAGARLKGSYHPTPFFTTRGQPVAEPQVLSLAERRAVTPE